ncbi:hypothetical protein [Mycoplasma leonicaptivi]|uniref:hypothetical protein n=1 Tax=Mycoplasma leonicaptivi TaxID=36742 RepID=UPI0004866919|nr:hypothetical protein [Mycoplasma leonicaptivi]
MEQNNNLNEKKIEIESKFSKTKKLLLKKYYLQRSIFLIMSLTSIIISAVIVILNLYSIRWNEYPQSTMIFFVIIAIISSVTTFIISIQSFINISNKKNSLKQNIESTKELIKNLENKTEISQDDLDSITEIMS